MSTMTGTPGFRWDPYFMRSGNEFKQFWKKYLEGEDRNILYVLGRGFDPRMCTGFESVLKAGGHGVRNCFLIEFNEGPSSPSAQHAHLVSKNLEKLKNLLQGRGRLLPKPLLMWSDDGPRRRRTGSRNAAEVFSDVSEFETYTDIVIDVSAMPRGIYFPLIGKTLYLLDNAKENNPGKSIPNLHVVVSENAKLDRQIRDVGIDDIASYIHGFSADLEMEATAGIPKVWIPILGEGQHGQLERIYTLINPDEICPVMPSPSLNPRRGDKLLIEYRELIFDQWRIEPTNIIYAAEQKPFDVYRQIHRALHHYYQALEPLGGCKAVISALSSKLLSIGALLATYEIGKSEISVGLAHVEAQGYEIAGADNGESILGQEELFTLWLE